MASSVMASLILAVHKVGATIRQMLLCRVGLGQLLRFRRAAVIDSLYPDALKLLAVLLGHPLEVLLSSCLNKRPKALNGAARILTHLVAAALL